MPTPTVVPCPVCDGTKLAPNGQMPCHNCGGQTMHGRASGTSYTRADGSACLHQMTGTRGPWAHITIMKCQHCPFTYEIDSSD